MRESPILRWASKITRGQIIAVAVMLIGTCLVLAGLTIDNWQDSGASMQTLHLMCLVIAFSVLMWGFWGAIASAGFAFITGAVVAIVAGHMSLKYEIPLARSTFWLENLLFLVCAFLCLRFAEREEVESTFGTRQLERLEAEFLNMAVQYGKREELFKTLEGRLAQAKRLEEMTARLESTRENVAESIQVCLEVVAQGIGKGEAEIAMYTHDGAIRHPRGGPAFEAEEGRDEIDQWMGEHRTALLVNNLPHDVRFTQEFGKKRQIMSVVAVPLIKDGRLRGMLRMTSVVPQAFSHDDLRFASEAATLLAPILPPPK